MGLRLQSLGFQSGKVLLLVAAAIYSFAANTCQAQAAGQGSEVQQTAPPPTNQQMQAELAAMEARIKELEARLAQSGAAAAPPDTTSVPANANPTAAEPAAAPPPPPEPPPPPLPAEHEHTMSLPGVGPQLKIRGFADFNLGFGYDANPLIFPLVPAGTTAHNTFQIGEVDLFLSSKLSRTVSFLGEIVIGADQTNFWGLDIERLQVTYKASRYFAISGGRYHTSIGYYNTAFHHGTWFQTATGRPFMYFFEDSGGMLPVHSVGITTTGLMPGTGNLELHWVAEVGNGRSSDNFGQPVQNFLSDKNHKDFNLAAYIKPHWVPGLQVGGSFYRDRMVPAGFPEVNQNIGSLYAVFMNSQWELLNEAVLVSDHSDGAPKSLNTPLMYGQISRKFGKYRPYFRYQYINAAANDPVLVFTGRYQGPSVGLRMDFTDYVALKTQYNRLYQRDVPPANGLDMQVSFAF